MLRAPDRQITYVVESTGNSSSRSGTDRQRHQDRPRHVRLGELVGLANVDQTDAGSSRSASSSTVISGIAMTAETTRRSQRMSSGQLTLRSTPGVARHALHLHPIDGDMEGDHVGGDELDQPAGGVGLEHRQQVRPIGRRRPPPRRRRVRSRRHRSARSIVALSMSTRSQAHTTTGSGAAGGDRLGDRRTGPRPGRSSATAVSPIAASPAMSPPWHHTGGQPAPVKASATRRAIGVPSTSSTPCRPHPPAAAAGQHDTGDSSIASSVSAASSAGTPDGSSCSRNWRQRSASSSSPIVLRHHGQPEQASQEAPVAGRPAHVPRSAPTVGTQGVEPSVIADPVVGVALDVVAPVVAERRPAVDQARVGGTRRRSPAAVRHRIAWASA